jgi:transketolase
LGGAFSASEILAELYFDIMNVKPEEPTWEGRDRFNFK